MGKWEYSKGLHELSNGVYAYLWPHGQWGYNNAGLVTEGDRSMLVDTLFDIDSTREMLDLMKRTSPVAAGTIDTLVVTHANGDHFYGSELVRGAEVVCTAACAGEMQETPPQVMAELMKAAPGMGDLGAFFLQCFKDFNFEGLNPLPATRTFEGTLDLTVGRKAVRLIEVGPAHTKGDMIVYLPEDQVVFAGDILFIGGTPIMWAGPVANWLRACDLMLDLDVKAVVPGHGPITDKEGIRSIKGYWEFIEAEARKRFEAGMPENEALADIDLGPYARWGESERIAVNLNRLYAEFRGDDSPANVIELFTSMAALGLKK
ncbi:MAG: MBL fold metallo-hydrolase [Proteobacteria bacterium]|nr:MBL fold metallo-hydrolase [Pseudomonadota bacterium]